MKKILTIALVALLAAGSVFAGFSGDASVGLGYNFEDKSYGFTNGSNVKITYELTSDSVDKLPEEGKVIAGVKASFALSIKEYKSTSEGAPTWNLKPSITEAYVKGTDWSVSILGAQDSQDFAASAIDKSSNPKKTALVATSVAANKEAAPGITATYKDWTVSAGFHHAVVKKDDAAATYVYYLIDLEKTGTNNIVATKAMTEEEFKGSDYAKEDKYFYLYKAEKSKATKKDVDTLTYSLTVATPDFAFGDITVKAGLSAGDAGAKKAVLGFSGKVSYSTEDIKASVASDLVLNNVGGDKVEVGADVALNAGYKSLVTFDAYYATKADTQAVITPSKSKANASVKNLLSLQVAADLKEFEIPVSLTLKAKDIINEKVFGVSAKLSLENSLTVKASFDIDATTKAYEVAGSVEYKYDIFSFAAGANYNSSKKLYFNASVETSELINGATLSLAYGPCEDSDGNKTTNFLAKEIKAGTIDLTCKIAF